MTEYDQGEQSPTNSEQIDKNLPGRGDPVDWVEDPIGREFPVWERDKSMIPQMKRDRVKWMIENVDQIVNGLDVCCERHRPIIESLNNNLVTDFPGGFALTPSSDDVGYALVGDKVIKILSDGRIREFSLDIVDNRYEFIFELIDDASMFSHYDRVYGEGAYCEDREG